MPISPTQQEWWPLPDMEHTAWVPRCSLTPLHNPMNKPRKARWVLSSVEGQVSKGSVPGVPAARSSQRRIEQDILMTCDMVPLHS